MCDESNNAPNTNVLSADVAFCKETGSQTIFIPIRITPHDRVEQEMVIAMSADICNEIDQEIISDLITAAAAKNAYDEDYVNANSYDDAMKVI